MYLFCELLTFSSFSRPGIQKYYSVEDYEADEDDEISFTKGEVLTVMQKRLDGWWLVEYKDKIGLAPGTLLKEGLPPEPEEQVRERETVREREKEKL